MQIYFLLKKPGT